MTKSKLALILATLQLLLLLQGCTAAVVGGAATGASMAHDRRTMGSFIEDQNIELKTASAISSNKALGDRSHINVTSYNRIVLLTGETPTHELRNQIQEIARGIAQVRRIHNEITIAAPSAMSSRGSDTWITTKVKTTLFKIKGMENFDATRVKVVTENGVVYLMGILTQPEADAVVDTARKVTGVKRVVKVFEYVN